MKAADLRKAILQAAVQGKLVPQDKNDEPASELLKRIQAEKTVLIKEGKLKKEKPLSPITQDEIPYDLPEGWVWCRVQEISLLITSGSRDWAKYYSDDGAQFIRMGNLSKDSFSLRLEKIQYVSPPQGSEGERTELAPGDILVSITADVGLLGLVPDGFGDAYINQHVALVRTSKLLERYYIPYAFLSPLCKEQFDFPQRGIKNSFRLTDLSYMLVPLPPLAEQQRIVAKVNELMALCDELEATEKELDALESHFFDYLPKSILQAAIQGKLVPQDKNDEPASELLKRIQAEKAALIKEGKLKKEKPLPPITEDEIPYDLPDGWAWCRVGDIHQVIRGITFPSSVKHSEIDAGLVQCATTGSVQKEYNAAADVFIPIEYVKREDQWLQQNDIIMSTANSRELVGKTCIWRENTKKTFGGFLTTLRPLGKINASYSHYIFKYMQAIGAFNTSSTQTTNIANINNEILKKTIYPLPPFSEQQRIVAKVDELMAMCDELKRVAEQPISHDNVVSFPAMPKENDAPIAIAARGKVEGMSDQAKQAIEDLFGEDE